MAIFQSKVPSKSSIPVLMGSKRKNVQRNNFMAVILFSDIIKTSLGPKGMYKMLVDKNGSIKVTSNGKTILKELEIEHPVIKIMVEMSKAIDNEVGDGTISSVILAGALLEKALELIDKGVHPTIIAEGYAKALEKSLEILSSIAIKIDPKDRDMLENLARTSMETKITFSDANVLAPLIVESLLLVAEEIEGKIDVDIKNIKVEKSAGCSIGDTKLVRGLIIPRTYTKEIMQPEMPKRVSQAKIAVINCPLKMRKPEYDTRISIDSPEQIQMLLDERNKVVKAIVDKIIAVGANVIVTNRDIDDLALYNLAKAKIMAIRRDLDADLSRLARATGARIIANIDELQSKDLGYADIVEEIKVGNEKWVVFEGCKNQKALSIFVRGGTDKVVEEVERAVYDALYTVKDAMIKPFILVGAGSIEEEIALRLKDWAKTLSGRKQLAVQKFAEGLETIPMTLAKNAGMDPINTITELRARHKGGEKTAGINAVSGKVEDVQKLDVYEPLIVKEQILKAATEVVSMILRIDGIIAASREQKLKSKDKEEIPTAMD
ncbi:MAG: thermosome subunit alpha [Nitrososphaeria archaeon]